MKVCSEDFCPIGKTACPGKCIYADILENVHTGIIGFDLANETVVYQNLEAEKIFKDIHPRDYSALCSVLLPDLVDLLDKKIVDLPRKIKYGDVFLDYTIYRVSGEYIWLFIRDVTAQEWAEKRLRDNERELQRYTLELERYAARLEDSEEQFRGIANAAMDSIIVLDSEGCITFWNPAAESMFGYSSEDVMGKDLHKLIAPEEYHEAYKRGFQDFMKTGEGPAIGESYEFMAMYKNGLLFPIEASMAAIKVKDKWHAVGIIRDVTRRKEADLKIREHEKEMERYTAALERYAKQLEETNEKFSGISSAATDSIIVMDNDGSISYWNPAAEQMFGYTAEDVLGKDLHELLAPGRYHESFRVGYDEFRLTGRGPVIGRPLEFMALKKDGTEFPIEVSTSAIKVEDKWHAIGIVRDITERKRAEAITEEINIMNNIGYVFSGIRHEIGNPINSIKTTISVLRHNMEKYTYDNIKVYLDRVIEELGRVEYLLRSLKSFSMYESPDLQNLNLKIFFDKFLLLIGSDFKNKGIRITTDIPEVDEWVYADARALNQIMLNLLTNAADALSGIKNPTVKISIFRKARTSNMVTTRVEDNGCGMTEDQLDSLFKPFYTSKAIGTGLGLTIVKKMVSKMNGVIEIESRKNQGTSIEISIPEGSAETE